MMEVMRVYSIDHPNCLNSSISRRRSTPRIHIIRVSLFLSSAFGSNGLSSLFFAPYASAASNQPFFLFFSASAAEVQEKVYKTLRHQNHVGNNDSLPRSISSIEGSKTASTALIGINGFARTPSLQRRKREEAASCAAAAASTDLLYARIDRSKKKNNNGGVGSNHSSAVSSPLTSPQDQDSAEMTTSDPHRAVIRVNPGANVGPDSPNRRPTTLYPSLSRRSSASSREPLYATIGTKRPLPTASHRLADV